VKNSRSIRRYRYRYGWWSWYRKQIGNLAATYARYEK